MIKRFLLLALMLLTLAGTAEAQLGTVPNTFIEGVNIIDDLNENFSIAYSTALNRTGGTMTGTLTSQGLVPATTATYDFGSALVKYRDGWFSRNLDVAGTFTISGAVSDSDSALQINDQLQVTSTTVAQLQVRYDSSNYLEASVSSAGAVTLNAVGASAGFVLSDPLTVSTATITSIANGIIFTGTPRISNIGAHLSIVESDAAADAGKWRIDADAGGFRLRTTNDAESVTNTVFVVSRSGATIGTFSLASTALVGQIGSTAAPFYTFVSDEDTGIFQSAANRIDFSTGGTRRWIMETTGDFLPGVSGTYNIGSAALPINQIFVDSNVYAGAGLGVPVIGSTSYGLGLTGTSVQLLSSGSEMLSVSGTGGSINAAVTASAPIYLYSVAFASFQAFGNGAVIYCTDCTVASPCAGGGTGAVAKRINSTWVCN
jgi:hypothetical protein